jgi:hypothetical protein
MISLGQCFDELIRQVTISCAERGLLLLRVRDEIRMTIAAYQTLYESSVAFGMRKALQAEQGRSLFYISCYITSTVSCIHLFKVLEIFSALLQLDCSSNSF